MKVFIEANAKLHECYLLDRKIMGVPLIVNSLNLAANLQADDVFISAPEAKAQWVSDLASQYLKKFRIVNSKAIETSDLVLNVCDVYNIKKAKNEYLKSGAINKALIWRITSEKDINSAEDELRRSFWFPIGRFYIVPIAKFLANKLSGTVVTPNQITIVSFLSGVLASVFLLLKYWPFYIISGFLYLFSWLLDITDGKLARKKGAVSLFGKWFDPVIGEGLDYILHFFIMLSVYLRTGSVFVLFVGISYFIGKHLAIFAMQMKAVKQDDEFIAPIQKSSIFSVFSRLAHFVHDADIRVHFTVLAILLNVPIVPLFVYAAYFNVWYILKIMLEYIKGKNS